MEKKQEIKEKEEKKKKKKNRNIEKQNQPPNISVMEPLNIGAYGGGMYGNYEPGEKPRDPPASQTQSADGEAGPSPPPHHKPPPSTGDKDLDITGQSYIQ